MYLKNIFSGRIGDEFIGINQGNDGNNFISDFFNHALVTDPNIIPDVDVLNEKIYISKIRDELSAFSKISACLL